jgi:hypothetical protein
MILDNTAAIISAYSNMKVLTHDEGTYLSSGKHR